MSQQDPKLNRIKEFLRKKDDDKINVVKENINAGGEKKFDPEFNKEFIKKKLLSNQVKETEDYYKSQQKFFESIKNKILIIPQKFQQYKRPLRRYFRDQFPFVAFCAFSTYVIYKMQDQYDSIQRKSQSITSYKQIEIEKEEEDIRQYLADEKPKLDIKIRDKQQKQKYKFQDLDDEQEGQDDYGFDTSQDFLKVLKEDYEKGITIPLRFQAQLNQYIQQEAENNRLGKKEISEEELLQSGQFGQVPVEGSKRENDQIQQLYKNQREQQLRSFYFSQQQDEKQQKKSFFSSLSQQPKSEQPKKIKEEFEKFTLEGDEEQYLQKNNNNKQDNQ